MIVLLPSWEVAASGPSSATPVSASPAQQNLSAADCRPCVLAIGLGMAPYEVRFILKDFPGGGRIVEELKLSSKGTPLQQTLTVHDMAPVRPEETFFIGTADINLDGFNDLFVATSRGVANTYADYWIFIPSTKTFSYIGNYPLFSVDRVKRRLSTYERGGYGGMVYEKTDYAFIDGRLTAVASEKQEPTEREGVFRKKLYQRKSGKLRLIKTEIVKAPAGK